VDFHFAQGRPIVVESTIRYAPAEQGDSLMAELNPFKIAQSQLDTAAATLGLDEATHQLLHGRWQNEALPRLPRAV
jgi:hypothetical protein